MISQNYLAGAGIGLMFDDNDALLGVCKTFSESTLGFSVTAEEVRGGPSNCCSLH